MINANVGGTISRSVLTSSRYDIKPVIIKHTQEDETIKYYLSILSICDLNMANVDMVIFNKSKLSLYELVSFDGSLPSEYEIYKDITGNVGFNSSAVGDGTNRYSYSDIKALEDRITTLENK